MSKKIIVVGAGIAGLSAAIYAQRSGFAVTLIEQHTIPGGMCTSWKRKGYLFEGAVHWLTGTSPNTPLHQLWREVGALTDDVQIFHHDPFVSMDWEGKTLCFYRDMEKTKTHLSALFPEDTAMLQKLLKDVKTLSKLQMPITDIKGVKTAQANKMRMEMLKMLPALPLLGKLQNISVEEYVQRFRHTALQKLLCAMVPSNYSATALLFTLATLHMGDGGYPQGGSLPMTQRMADTFQALGGKLLLGTKVKRIIIENGIATGVELAEEHLSADAVIITQETIAAINQLFTEPPKDQWLQELCQNTKPTACTFVSIGVRAELPETPIFTLPQPITCGGISYDELSFNNYSGFAGHAPAGCTTLTHIFMGDSYDFWKQAKDQGRYEAEKQMVAEQITQALCAKYPKAQGSIEVVDVATPLTYARYTGAYHGSWMGAMEKGDKQTQYPGYLDSIKGVYFAGHRMTSPGGLPVALTSGRTAAQLVCRQFDMVFCSKKPALSGVS